MAPRENPKNAGLSAVGKSVPFATGSSLIKNQIERCREFSRQRDRYYGVRSCLDAVQTFVYKPLNKLTPEEDFMPGIMLGYDISMQCERYCKRKFHLSGLIA